MQIIKKKISDLISDPSNARKHDEKNISAIKGSLARFGQQKPIVINKDSVVIAGNGTLEAAKALGWSEISCVVTELKGTDLVAYGIADNRSGELAEWNNDILGKLLQGLKDDGFDLDSIGFDTDDLDFLDQNSENGDDSIYTSKIESPIYKPTGKKPEIHELYDTKLTFDLISDIEKADISDEEKNFLKAAASRHTVFNYSNIAEFYAHSMPEVQRLMERSALVIIDFNQAIENGFVKLSKDIAEIYASEHDQ